VQRAVWSESVSTDEAHARYLARRRYNALRRDQAALRRVEVAELIVAAGGFLVPGVRSRIAAKLGVHRSTVSRDVAALLRGLPSPWCPCCGAASSRALDRLEELLASKQAAS
jgi:predicted naringenin-chalcone synthase